ncbi:MAG: helix-turn-helix transcriptional regulator [Alcaligenes sp.]|uniref:helix-turn-helix domain-containing protein n=1 Tax=Alcaligenes pakistanensis TaxID=1482717 RepID=UPI000ED46A6C|nr:helix-turn-helix transcriptional regulator [Alcaligenes pakistanensis]MBP6622553.1 helix-turn-helix transcriptional regulator [Alcaligenes sp.]HCA17636.1 transcriptional regulator [Alcaligenes faecalis]
MKHFSERLLHARQHRGLSQAGLARLCGLSQSAISNYENGTRRDAREILELARALNVSALWLRKGTGKMEFMDDGYTLSEPQEGPPIVSWPFRLFSVDEVVALADGERDLLDRTIRHLLDGMRKR